MTEQNQQEQVIDKGNEPTIADLLGEVSKLTGKNIDSPEALKKKVLSSEEYIQKIEAENAQTREMLAKALDAIEKSTKAESVLSQLTKPKEDAPQAQGFSEEKAKEIFSNLYKSSREEEIQSKNYQEFNSNLVKALGDGAAEKLQSRIKELNLNVEDVKALATKSPQAALKLIGVSSNQQGGAGIITSSVNSLQDNKPTISDFDALMATKNIKKGTPAYFAELYKAKIF